MQCARRQPVWSVGLWQLHSLLIVMQCGLKWCKRIGIACPGDSLSSGPTVHCPVSSVQLRSLSVWLPNHDKMRAELRTDLNQLTKCQCQARLKPGQLVLLSASQPASQPGCTSGLCTALHVTQFASHSARLGSCGIYKPAQAAQCGADIASATTKTHNNHARTLDTEHCQPSVPGQPVQRTILPSRSCTAFALQLRLEQRLELRSSAAAAA